MTIYIFKSFQKVGSKIQKLGVLGGMLLGSQLVNAQSIPGINIDGITLSNQTTVYASHGTITSPSSSSNPVLVTGSAQIEYKAGKQINLKPGFKASAMTSGKFQAHIQAQDFDVVFIEPNSTFPSVGKFEKIELGLQVPTNIEQLVNDYLINNASNGINPYDPDQISVEATFHWGTTMTKKVYGFYYKEYTRGTTQWNEQSTQYPWRIRFAPPELGNWSCEVDIKFPSSTSLPQLHVDGIAFNCSPSNNHGYLEVGLHKRQFRFSENHQSFFAIGQNIAWPDESSWGSGILEPQEFADFSGWVEDVADNGGNYARIIMAPWGHDIEWEKLGDYNGRQNVAWELDQVFNTAEAKGLFIHLCIEMQSNYNATNPTVGSVWLWGNNPYNSNSTHNDSKFTGVTDPLDALTSSDAQKYFKRRLRYIVARWGYSTSLATYELLSEQDGWDGYRPNGQFDSNIDHDSYLWHAAMSSYLRYTLDDPHLISTCFATHPYGTVYNLNDLDFTSIHKYAASKGSAFERYDYFNKDAPLNTDDGTLTIWDKPTIFGELGLAGDGADPDDIEGCDDVNFHNCLWSTAFMGGYGTGLEWWQWRNNTYRADNFPPLQSFFSSIDFENNKFTYPQCWRDFHWDPTPNCSVNHNHEFISEVFALRNFDKEKLIGWVHNATWWWGNVSENCVDRNNQTMNLPCDNDTYYDPQYFCCEKYELSGLKLLKKYDIEYYTTRNPAVHLTGIDDTKKTNIFGHLKPNQPGYADIAFKVVLDGSTFRLNDTVPADTLLCNEDTIHIDGTYENDIEGTYSYSWNFGNGQISNLAHPTVIYSTPGTYTVTLIVTDTLMDKDTITQVIVKPDCNQQNTKLAAEETAYIAAGFYKIIPNPSMGRVTILTNEPGSTGEIKIVVYDMLGKIVASSNMNLTETGVPIDITGNARGIYYIRITDNQKTSIQKVIIQ